MRNFINTTTVMDVTIDRQNRADVSGIELRMHGPVHLHLYARKALSRGSSAAAACSQGLKQISCKSAPPAGAIRAIPATTLEHLPLEMAERGSLQQWRLQPSPTSAGHIGF